MFRTLRPYGLALALSLSALFSGWGEAANKYGRLTPAGDNQVKAETSVVRFRSTKDPELEVHLVGVVHIGERGYYEKLNGLLDGYDAVLYELVAPKGTLPRKDKLAYADWAEALGLDPQGMHIDYTRKHFVHADMSMEEVKEAFRKRGKEFKEPDLAPVAQLLKWLGPVKGRWMMAELFKADEGHGDAVIIGDRNQVALKELEEQIAKGSKKIAIFYGAGHMPDLEWHLMERFGMEEAGSEWLTAWTMAKLEESAMK